mmetsp:Transcript_11610/g.14501  ORF Transcript_11610/g.14501 Transcript_11610/m.14501 type:complete len:123 (-) Transcript_11610:257-625(-)
MIPNAIGGNVSMGDICKYMVGEPNIFVGYICNSSFHELSTVQEEEQGGEEEEGPIMEEDVTPSRYARSNNLPNVSQLYRGKSITSFAFSHNTDSSLGTRVDINVGIDVDAEVDIAVNESLSL